MKPAHLLAGCLAGRARPGSRGVPAALTRRTFAAALAVWALAYAAWRGGRQAA